MTKSSFRKHLFDVALHEDLKPSLVLIEVIWHDSFPNFMLWSQQSNLIKSMFIKVWSMVRFCVNLSFKLCDYNTWMGSWLPVSTATTNRPFGVHFEHVHVLTSSHCLPPPLGPKFILTPRWESNFNLSLCKKIPFVPYHLITLLSDIHYVHDAISWRSLTFISLATSSDSFTKMLLLDGILSTWPNTPIPTPLVALTWARLPFQILVCYQQG